MMKHAAKNRLIWVLLLISALLILLLVQHSLFLQSLLRINRMSADNGLGHVNSSLVWNRSGYEMIIFGDGEMSPATPAQWDKELIHISYGWKVPIRSVVVKEGVQTLSANLFLGCNRLTSLSLPASLHSIGPMAFAYCSALTSVQYHGTVAQWDTLIQASPEWDRDSSIRQVICLDGNWLSSP